MNFLMPFVQRIPNALLRSEWASRIAQQLRVDEPVLREALAPRRGRAPQRSEDAAALAGRAAKPAERRLVQMLMEPSDFRERLAKRSARQRAPRGLRDGENSSACCSRHAPPGATPDATGTGAETRGTATGGCCSKSRSRAARKRVGKRRRAVWRCCAAANRRRSWRPCSGRSKLRTGSGDERRSNCADLQERKLELRRRLSSAAP